MTISANKIYPRTGDIQTLFRCLWRKVPTELSPEEKARFREAVAPIYEEFYTDYSDIIDAIAAEGAQEE